MIIVKLQGGLGNQMFQYALGRQLSIIHNTVLKLDVEFLLDRTPKEHFTFRDYELDSFQINPPIADHKEVVLFYRKDPISKIMRHFSRIKQIRKMDMRFHSSVLNSGDHVYLDGYWQCENYFNAIRKELLHDFTLKDTMLNELQEKNREIIELINKTNSVSIHFRRGDYVTDSQTNRIHGSCTVDYYLEAINLIRKKNPFAHFFLFSDDPEWVSKTQFLKDTETTIITTGNKHFEMHLMSLCKHNIIANSSFSWWGAWLNKNEDKIVIAPKRWFAKDEINKQTQDLIPQSWIRL